MLIGNFLAKLDTKKGRTALPSKFRDQVGDKIIITLGYEHSLMIIDQTSWGKVIGGVINKPFISGPARETDRFLLGSAFEIELDSQGRFIIPQSLRMHAELSQNIVFVGVGNRIEVWDVVKWEHYKSYLDKNIELIAEKLNDSENK